jgi:hypothetical protein
MSRGDDAQGRKAFVGVPTFFKASCSEARLGGKNGYKRAGYTLARHVDDLLSDVYDRPQIESQLNELADALKIEPSEDEALEWFDREFPRCMELVPARRRSQFIQGAAQAYEEGLLV